MGVAEARFTFALSVVELATGLVIIHVWIVSQVGLSHK